MASGETASTSRRPKARRGWPAIRKYVIYKRPGVTAANVEAQRITNAAEGPQGPKREVEGGEFLSAQAGMLEPKWRQMIMI